MHLHNETGRNDYLNYIWHTKHSTFEKATMTEVTYSVLYLTESPILQINFKLECGPMPNVMVALPNIGGTLCSTPQSLADAHYYSAVQ